MKRFALGLFCLFLGFALISVLSQSFHYGYGHVDRPLLGVIASLLLAWFGFALCWRMRTSTSKKILWSGLVLGIILRAMMFVSEPIQEDDFYRYIWDGQVILHGMNPYTKSPSEMSLHDLGIQEGDSVWIDAYTVKDRVNYPEVSTVYPPVAEWFLAATQWLSPWKLWGLRLCLLWIDILCLLSVLLMLKRMHKPLAGALLYWLNPLLLKEIHNSLHFDILCAFFLILVVLCLSYRSYFGMLLALWAAVMSKITPILVVAPVLIYANRQRMTHMWSIPIVFVLTCGAAFYALGIVHGLREFGTHWQINSSVYYALRSVLGLDWGQAIKFVFAVFHMLHALYWSVRVKNESDLLKAMLWILTGVFLLSPCGNPWYVVWLIPLWAMHGGFSWVVLMAALSLYYGIFYLEYHGLEEWIPYLYTLEWGVVFGFFALAAMMAFKKRGELSK